MLCRECSEQQDCVARCGNRTIDKRDRVTGEAAEKIYEMQSQSIFCMQPWGDSASRKSFYDALLAGCINVLFVPLGYGGMLEGFGDYRSYSIVVPIERVEQDGGALTYLRSIGKEKVEEIHGNILKDRERFIYSATPVPPGHDDAVSVIMNSLPSKMEYWEPERIGKEKLGMMQIQRAAAAAAVARSHMMECRCGESPIFILGDKKGTQLVQRILSTLPGTYIASNSNSGIYELLGTCEQVRRRKEKDPRVLARCADLVRESVNVPRNATRWGSREEEAVSVKYYVTLKQIFPCSKFILVPYERESAKNQAEHMIVQGRRRSGFVDVWETERGNSTSDILSINTRHTAAKKLTSIVKFLGYKCYVRVGSTNANQDNADDNDDGHSKEDNITTLMSYVPVCGSTTIDCSISGK